MTALYGMDTFIFQIQDEGRSSRRVTEILIKVAVLIEGHIGKVESSEILGPSVEIERGWQSAE